MSKPKKYCIGTELEKYAIIFPDYLKDKEGKIIAFATYDKCLQYVKKHVAKPYDKHPGDFIYYNDNL